VTNPFSSDGAKAPAKPYTVTEGERRIRSFVLRRAAGSSVFERIPRVATRWRNPTAALALGGIGAICMHRESSDD
jgi:hypothetical protein